MESNTLEGISEQKEMGTVVVRDGQTGKVLLVSKKAYEQAQSKDKSVANVEFPGFYISPGFSFYETRKNFYMFCED